MVTHKPNDAKSYYNRANAYRDKVDFDKAIEDFSMQIRLQPDDAETYYDRGKIYGEKGEYDKAVEDFSKSIELHPEFTEAYAKRALAYFRMDKFESALQDYDKVLELNPKTLARFVPAFDTLFLGVKDIETDGLTKTDHLFGWLLTVLQNAE